MPFFQYPHAIYENDLKFAMMSRQAT